jgi:pimeloyl-ACP methyl ester carboxylesterase
VSAAVVVHHREDGTPGGAPLLVLIADGIAGARFEVLADAAHLATDQQPDAANRLIVEALDDR